LDDTYLQIHFSAASKFFNSQSMIIKYVSPLQYLRDGSAIEMCLTRFSKAGQRDCRVFVGGALSDFNEASFASTVR
jgi:hypothetical protein